jgi:hypothetical protein
LPCRCRASTERAWICRLLQLPCGQALDLPVRALAAELPALEVSGQRLSGRP